MSGGPVVDQYGNYIGMMDESTITAPVFKVGFVPFRVLKPQVTNGKLTLLVDRYGFTFRDYATDPTGNTSVHATYQASPAGGEAPWLLSKLEVTSPNYQAEVQVADVGEKDARANLKLVFGKSRPSLRLSNLPMNKFNFDMVRETLLLAQPK